VTCEQFIAALSRSATRGAELASANFSANFNEHAASCTRCSALWQTDQRLSAALKARQEPLELPGALRQLLSEPRGSRRASSVGTRLLAVSLSCLACLAFAVVFVPRPDLGGAFAPGPLRVFVAFGILLLGILSAFLYRGRSGLGAPAWLRWLLVALAVLGFHGVIALVTDATHDVTQAGGGFVPPRDCLALGLSAGLVVGFVVLAVSRYTALVSPRASGALAGAAAGYAGLLFLHLHCPAQQAAHLHAVHGLPLLLLVVVGLVSGRRWLSV
jgi:hypothetical protein